MFSFQLFKCWIVANCMIGSDDIVPFNEIHCAYIYIYIYGLELCEKGSSFIHDTLCQEYYTIQLLKNEKGFCTGSCDWNVGRESEIEKKQNHCSFVIKRGGSVVICKWSIFQNKKKRILLKFANCKSDFLLFPRYRHAFDIGKA